MTWTCHICGTLATTSNALVLNGGPIVHRNCADRCPDCQGVGGVLVDSMILYGIPGGEDWARCETCKGTGRVNDDAHLGQKS